MMSSRTVRLALARVLTALGRTAEAQEVVLEQLDENPEDLTLLSLLAKLKHLRGELSQAIGLWATVYSRARHADVALPQLMALRHLAEDPERAAGAFVALRDGHLLKKHHAQIELERAFRLLADERVADAEAVCESVVRRHRERDRDVYKLASLARAWIRELTGDLAGARRALEALGEERGFETDIDRLLFLVRVYEKLGRPEDVRAAIKVYAYLQRNFDKLSIYAQLARLYRATGEVEAAAANESRYLDGFRRRMHKLTFGDLVRAAQARYLPLAALRGLETIELVSEDPPVGGLSDALREALRGGGARADAMLAGLGTEGAAYRADLRAERGDLEEAVVLYGEALASSAGEVDAGLVARLCDLEAGEPILARLAGNPAWLESAIMRLHEAARSQPGEGKPWERLAKLERAAGRGDDADRHAAKAAALVAADPVRRSPGRVFAAAVYRFVGKTKGLVHELLADRVPAEHGRGGALDLHGNLAPDLVESVRNTFLATRGYARHKFPHLTLDLDSYRYTFKVTKEDEPSGGLSAGLPTAVAFFSVFVGRAVPEDVALSGRMVADAHNVLAVQPVGDVEAKVKGAYHRDLRRLVLPLDSRPEVDRSSMVPREVSASLVRYARTLDDALEHVFGKAVWDW